MQHTPVATAIGVELGSSSVRLSVRRGDQESEIRELDGDQPLEAVLGRVRDARDQAGGAVPVGFAVPASWGAARRQELVYLAGETGLGEVEIMAAPEAAAVCYVKGLGRELGPGAGLVVCDLGARSFEVSIVVRGEDDFQHRGSVTTGEVGGREFDQLLFAYLSGRYRDTDPEFWDKVGAPTDIDEEALRASLLDEIRSARELISKRPRAGVHLPIGERDLHLTRDEVESCIGELLLQSADLVVQAIAEADTAVTGLILVGGASRTPLLATVLAERTGLDPVLPAFPEAAAADGARIVALANAPVAPAEGTSRGKTTRRLGVLAAVLLPLVAAGAVFGNQLGDDQADGGASETPEPTASAATSDAASSVDEEGGSGVGGQEAPGSPQAVASESASETEDDDESQNAEESASVGTVPDVAGMTANDAEAALNGAGFTDVSRTGEQEGLFGPWYDDCEVIGQDPAAGEERPLADPVTITYSYAGTDPSVCD
ncbi:Hsp70 family protein [Glycomyces dulcitolivorans]|uniref:Hsp70 family protein n=1 Tax=Glycomyces dulcitolivorans TaxID=2200759 RepID=UPI000DD40246|nr:Hsp70 family protein [Glycomyces dulcitolivorans]